VKSYEIGFTGKSGYQLAPVMLDFMRFIFFTTFTIWFLHPHS